MPSHYSDHDFAVPASYQLHCIRNGRKKNALWLHIYKYYCIPHYCTLLLIPKSVSCGCQSVARTVIKKCKMVTYRFKKFFTVHLQWQLFVIMFLVILPYFMVEKILLVLECFRPTCNRALLFTPAYLTLLTHTVHKISDWQLHWVVPVYQRFGYKICLHHQNSTACQAVQTQ